MNNDNPWFESRTPEHFILARRPVTELTQDIVEKIVTDSENAIRRKDVDGVMSFIALDFKYFSTELIDGQLKMAVGNRDRFQIGICGTFEMSNCDNYSMEVSSIEINDSGTAKVKIVVRNPGDSLFANLIGSKIMETVFITLYQGRPVISRLEIENQA